MLQRISTLLTGILIGLSATGLLLLLISRPRKYPIELQPPPTPRPLLIHIAGAVRNPGVFELPRDAIVSDAIDAAGGPKENADLDRVNLAASLEDNQQVYVPEEVRSTVSSPSELDIMPINDDNKININSATVAELDRLPGIGPALAEEIIRHREVHGLFHSLDDLLDVSGIGPAKIEKISDLISFQ